MENLNYKLSKERAIEIVKELGKDELYRKFNLTCGNCGIFAIALRDLISEGELWGINRTCHVVLKLDDMFIDGTGCYTKEEIEKQWVTENGVEPEDIDEKEIIEQTCRTLKVKDMKDIILALSQDAISKALKMYKTRHKYYSYTETDEEDEDYDVR